MLPIDRIVKPYAFVVSSAVMAITAGWLALTFIVTVGGAIVGA